MVFSLLNFIRLLAYEFLKLSFNTIFSNTDLGVNNMSTIDKNKVLELLEKHSQLEQVDFKLTQELLDELGLAGTCSLGSVLNSEVEEEREAARKKIRVSLDDLLSGDPRVVEEARDTLGQFYYCVDTSGILEG